MKPTIDANSEWVVKPASHNKPLFRRLLTNGAAHTSARNHSNNSSTYEQRWHAWGREQQKAYTKPTPKPSDTRFHHVSDDYWRVTNKPNHYNRGDMPRRKASVIKTFFTIVGYAFLASTIYFWWTTERPNIREERELQDWITITKQRADNYQKYCIDNNANNKPRHTLEPWEVYAGCRGK